MPGSVVDERCILCDRPATAFAKSHIIPRSFYNRLPQITGVDIGKRFYCDIYDEQGEKRITHNGHYILNKICRECERHYLAYYDEYAANLYLQHQNEANAAMYQSNQCKLHLIPPTENRAIARVRLRAFWASLLWRFSVDSTTFTNFKLSESWENRIRQDMLSGNSFNYISVIPISLDSPAMAIIDEPKYVSDPPSDSSCIIKVRLPCFAAFIGLNNEVSFTKKTIMNAGILYSCSLDDEFAEAGYFFPEIDELIGECQFLFDEYKVVTERRELAQNRER